MKLTRKHIGGLFDNEGGDGSWAYQLVDVKKGWLLFSVVGEPLRYEADKQIWHDWRPFKSQSPTRSEITRGWETARRIDGKPR